MRCPAKEVGKSKREKEGRKEREKGRGIQN